MTRRPAPALRRPPPGGPAARGTPEVLPAPPAPPAPPVRRPAAGGGPVHSVPVHSVPGRRGSPAPRGRRGSVRDGPPARRRRPSGRAVLAALLLAAVLLAAGWALLFSPLTAVASVSVVGTDRTPAATVEAAAGPQLGTPLMRWDAGAIEDRLRGAPYVRDVSLARRWPDRVEVQVRERVPVAAVPRAGGGVDVVDARGDVITRAAAAPDGLPTVTVDARASGRAALDAATLTARSLPRRLRTQVETVGATSGDDVRLTLRGGRVARWGDGGLPESKAQVLLVLLDQVPQARGFDVSAPSAPATWTQEEPPEGGPPGDESPAEGDAESDEAVTSG